MILNELEIDHVTDLYYLLKWVETKPKFVLTESWLQKKLMLSGLQFKIALRYLIENTYIEPYAEKAGIHNIRYKIKKQLFRDIIKAENKPRNI